MSDSELRPTLVPPVLVIPPATARPDEQDEPDKDDSLRQLVLGFVFGIVFGFLLQKGGVARYEVLMGQFLLTDFTVIKVMVTAIAVGMVGVFAMRALGLVKLHVKPTRYAANIVGGLLFGIGMAVFGYCPGTGATALGQGNFDAIAGIAGLMAGSYLFAETSDYVSATIQKIGNRGKIMLPDLVGINLAVFVVLFVPLLALGLVLLERWAP